MKGFQEWAIERRAIKFYPNRPLLLWQQNNSHDNVCSSGILGQKNRWGWKLKFSARHCPFLREFQQTAANFRNGNNKWRRGIRLGTTG